MFLLAIAIFWIFAVVEGAAVPSCENALCDPNGSSPCCSPLLSCKRHTQSFFCANSTSGSEEFRCVRVPLERRRFPAYREPVVLQADPVTQVLEVRLIARASDTYLNSVGRARNVFLFDWVLLQGTSSNGFRFGYEMYPAPTLQVFPRQTLLINVENELLNDFPDFYNPMISKANESVPLYPPQLPRPPFNLHTHGLHVSPKGNGDNVLLNIGVGEGNQYKYNIPDNHPQGLYWYHSHLHKLTAVETYRGLAGLLSIGRSDGNLPKVTANSIPIRNMAFQYNFVYGRGKGGNIFNDPNRPQFVSTLVPPANNESIFSGAYEPKLYPFNFVETPGDDFVTVWFAGPLSENNNRGQFQFIPGNLQNYTSDRASVFNRPPNPALDPFDRDVQFTVNGQFQPRLATCPGGTEIWVLANICDFTYMRVKIRETATGLFQQLHLVGQDGNPMPNVQSGLIENGTCIVLPPASRFAIAVSIPRTGSLILELPPVVAQLQKNINPGIRYFKAPSATAADLGTITVSNDFVSYFDGFFLTPTQVLLETVPVGGGTGPSCPFSDFPIGSSTGAFSSFVNTAEMPVNFSRTWLVGGGFPPATQFNINDPQGFMYFLNNMVFPFTPLAQPRLNTVEEWVWLNQNNDQHPIHIHVNDFQVMETNDPTYPLQTGVRMWGQDNANLPYPQYDNQGNVVVNGSMTLRTFFQNYTGIYVYHCHRLNHEDFGLMAVVNVIPTISIWVSSSGNVATIYDQAQDLPIASVVVSGTVISTAVDDFDGDQIFDVAVAYSSTQVVIFSGASNFSSALGSFDFPRPIISIAAANIDGNSFGSNVIVADVDGLISVFSSTLPTTSVLTTFVPFSVGSVVSLSTGMLDLHAGRFSIVCASAGVIRVFTFHSTALPLHPPKKIAQFSPFGPGFSGPLSTCTGFGSAAIGGGMVLFVAGNNQVQIFSSGSALSGLFPDLYGQSTNAPDSLSFSSVGMRSIPGASFIAFSSTVLGGNIFVASQDSVSRFTFSPNYTSKLLDTSLVKVFDGKASSLSGQ